LGDEHVPLWLEQLRDVRLDGLLPLVRIDDLLAVERESDPVVAGHPELRRGHPGGGELLAEDVRRVVVLAPDPQRGRAGEELRLPRRVRCGGRWRGAAALDRRGDYGRLREGVGGRRGGAEEEQEGSGSQWVHRGSGEWGGGPAGSTANRGGLCEDLFDHVAVDVGQAVVGALEPGSQLRVLQPDTVQR